MDQWEDEVHLQKWGKQSSVYEIFKVLARKEITGRSIQVASPPRKENDLYVQKTTYNLYITEKCSSYRNKFNLIPRHKHDNQVTCVNRDR